MNFRYFILDENGKTYSLNISIYRGRKRITYDYYDKIAGLLNSEIMALEKAKQIISNCKQLIIYSQTKTSNGLKDNKRRVVIDKLKYDKHYFRNLDLLGYNFNCFSDGFYHFSKRVNDYKSKHYGEYECIKCTYEDVRNNNIVDMARLGVSR